MIEQNVVDAEIGKVPESLRAVVTGKKPTCPRLRCIHQLIQPPRLRLWRIHPSLSKEGSRRVARSDGVVLKLGRNHGSRAILRWHGFLS